MEVGFGRGVGRKGNGMMRERMKTEEKMRWNTMTLEFESRPCNESFARVSAAAFLAQLNPTVEEVARSEERRVGKECRSRWSPYH